MTVLCDHPQLTGWSMRYYAERLAAGLEHAGATVTVVQGPGAGHGREGSWLWKLERYAARYLKMPRGVPRADVYHVTDQANAHWVRALPPERTVVTCHDLMLCRLAAGEIAWPGRRPHVASAAFRWSAGHLRRAALVLCDSQATRADALRLVGCAPERLRVVLLGIDESFRPLDREACRRELGLPWPFLVLHVGGSNFYKNVEGLLSALAALPADLRERTGLVKVGAPLTAAQATLARSLGLADRLHYAGEVDTAALVRLYNAADVVAFPSLWEGFGLPPLEAMACGTPVLCSTRGSLAETAGDAAALVDPDDSAAIAATLAALLQDGALRATLVARGTARAQQFQWGPSIEAVLAAYRTLPL